MKFRMFEYYAYKILYKDASFEAFAAVMFQVEVFWVVTSGGAVVGYQCLRGPCCLHLQHHAASQPRGPRLV